MTHPIPDNLIDHLRSYNDFKLQAAATALESAQRTIDELREALCLIKLACLGTSEADGWTAKRVIHCTTRICIDAGISEPYYELGTEQRYRAITRPTSEIGNRVLAALNKERSLG